MPSSKTQDYVVERIISKRTDRRGRIFYLIQWKGYSSSDNTWEPKSNVTNCSDLIKQFEAEQAGKNKSKNTDLNTSPTRISNRSTRSSLLPSKISTNKTERVSRRSLTARKRTYSDASYVTDDEDDQENDYVEKKSIRASASKRARRNTSDTESTHSLDSHDSDILDSAKLDRILNVRRDKKTNTVEYHIQVKNVKKPVWIKSARLTDDYSQQVIDFLEETYV